MHRKQTEKKTNRQNMQLSTRSMLWLYGWGSNVLLKHRLYNKQHCICNCNAHCNYTCVIIAPFLVTHLYKLIQWDNINIYIYYIWRASEMKSNRWATSDSCAIGVWSSRHDNVYMCIYTYIYSHEKWVFPWICTCAKSPLLSWPNDI